MNNHKKYFLFFILTIFVLLSNAQIIRIKGGINVSNYLYESGGVKLSSLYNITSPGFQAGASYESLFSDLLSLETGIMITSKGAKIDATNNVYPYAGKLNLFYIDIPFVLKTSFAMGKSSKWFLAAGPWLGIGIAGNVTAFYTWTGDKQGDKQKVKWGNGEGELKRFDGGVTLGGGVEFNHWQIAASYDMALPDLAANDTDIIKTRVWKLTLGYRLGK